MNESASKASLQIRLIGILGMTLIVGALITLATILVFNRLQDRAIELVQNADTLNNAWQLRNLTSRIERSQISYLLTQDPRYIRDNERYRQQFSQILTNNNAFQSDPSLAHLSYELERELWAYQGVFESIQQAGERGDWEQAAERAQNLGIHLTNLQRRSAQLTTYLQPSVEAQLQSALLQVRVMSVIGLVVFIAFTALILAAGGLTDRHLTRPIRHLVETLKQIPSGTFSPQSLDTLIRFGDQLGDLTWALVQVVDKHQERKARLQSQILALNEQIQRLQDGTL
jgi:CHASE3 domain sensor protein